MIADRKVYLSHDKSRDFMSLPLPPLIQPRAHPGAQLDKPSPNPLLILVVEDEATIAELLVEVIEEYGYAALRAKNGAEGLKLARHHHPALIISDVMMPVMDGYGLLRAIRSEPDLANTTVVLISAAFLRHIPPESPAADAYINKPFNIQELGALLDQIQGL
ncbi:MAG: response regulator [Roseiflexaceae bacterium]|nr:response regulator [Roseiflexaceae bacterium]